MAIADRSMKLIPCNDVTAWYSPDEFTSRLTHVGPCSALSSAAEKELASFYSAVKELFGPTVGSRGARPRLHAPRSSCGNHEGNEGVCKVYLAGILKYLDPLRCSLERCILFEVNCKAIGPSGPCR
jgi:hypothetical protein